MSVHLRYASRGNRLSIPSEPAVFPRKRGASIAILLPLLVLSFASAQLMALQSSARLDPPLAPRHPGKQSAPVGSGEPVSETSFHAESLRSPAKFIATQSGPIFWGTLEYSSGGERAGAVAVADFNGDGHPDLVVANYTANDCDNCSQGLVSVLLGNGDATFEAPTRYDSGGQFAASVAVGDVNGDGKPDLVVANQCADSNCTNGSVSVLLGNGDGTFQPAVSYSLSGPAYSVAVGDVNGDGKPDLVVASNCASSSNCTNGSVSVLLGNGDATFQPAVSYSLSGPAYSVAIGDVNGDGHPDLVVGYSEGIAVLLGNGDGTFQAPVSHWFGADNTVAIGDVNGDGYPDLVVASWCQSYCNSFVVVLLGNGDGTFQEPIFSPTSPFPLCCAPQSPALADFDGDGKLDVALGANSLMLGNGDGTFQTAMLLGASGFGVVAGDLNGDGKSELAVAGGNQVAILLNIPANFHWAATITVTSSANPATGPVTFTATVTPAFNAGPLTGNVTFYDGTTELGTVAISNGQSKFGTSSLSLGVHSIAAAYSGDANYAASTSPVLLETINPTVTTTAGVSSLNPSAFGQSVTFMATVTPTAGGTPTGVVTFTYGSTILCNAVTLVGGVATCAYSALPVGSDIVTAAYSDDSNFSDSSASINQTVNRGSTTLTLTSSVNPLGPDQPVTFIAKISPLSSGQAGGTITFNDGETTLGSIAVSGNAASLTTSGLAMGTHYITAVYSGDSNFTGSTSNTVTQVVTNDMTSLASSVSPSVSGKPVTFTAVVSSPAGTPTGKVQFLNGGTVLATVKLKSGSAKYTTSKLPPGSNIITAVYEGDSNNNSSVSAPLDQFVLAVTTITVTSSPNPSTSGGPVTVIGVVTSSTGAAPDGETVSFMNGKTVLGTGSLSEGSAAFTTSSLKVGATAVTAVYGGDSNFLGSKSKPVKQVVKKAD